MADIPFYDARGKRAGTLEVDEKLFGDRVRWKLLHQVVVAYESNRRQGTHCTRTRGEVSGGGRKPWPQKKLGRARHGSIRSPIWRGGAIAHGPRPRSYRRRINKSMRRTALNSALLGKIRDGEVHVIESLGFARPRTKEMRAILQAAGLNGSLFIVVEAHDRNRWLSTRNLPKVRMAEVRSMNAYDLVRHRQVLFTRDAFRTLVEERRGTLGEPKP